MALRNDLDQACSDQLPAAQGRDPEPEEIFPWIHLGDRDFDRSEPGADVGRAGFAPHDLKRLFPATQAQPTEKERNSHTGRRQPVNTERGRTPGRRRHGRTTKPQRPTSRPASGPTKRPNTAATTHKHRPNEAGPEEPKQNRARQTRAGRAQPNQPTNQRPKPNKPANKHLDLAKFQKWLLRTT